MVLPRGDIATLQLLLVLIVMISLYAHHNNTYCNSPLYESIRAQASASPRREIIVVKNKEKLPMLDDPSKSLTANTVYEKFVSHDKHDAVLEMLMKQVVANKKEGERVDKEEAARIKKENDMMVVAYAAISDYYKKVGQIILDEEIARDKFFQKLGQYYNQMAEIDRLKAKGGKKYKKFMMRLKETPKPPEPLKPTPPLPPEPMWPSMAPARNFAPPSKPPRLCVIFHFTCPERWHSFKPYLRNLRIDYDIYVTVPIPFQWIEDWQYNAAVRRVHHLFNSDVPMLVGHRNVYVLPMESTGLDSGGFLVAMAEIMRTKREEQYEVILNIQTKSENYGDWQQELLEPLLGSQDQVLKCLTHLSKHRRAGIVAATKWILEEQMELNELEEFAERNKLPTKKGSKALRRFVGGMMFWGRFSLFLKIFTDRGVDPLEVFYDMRSNYAFDWMERSVGDWVELSGYTIDGI
eukprot:TRINITY_DN13809_c0_g1_i1.p1 TRINITY_DN13809_c0_g1~~TRINITY_DN13809_c0_g1_i1.p1  ORF type:complete len:464 (+),score=101.42 TRINITY_DN13809_c0_g1_i1:153-1544(+)